MIQLDLEKMEEAVKHLENGGVVVFPTETSYAVGCDATNTEAVEKVFAIKKRSKDKALPVIIPSLESAATYIEVSPMVEALTESHWPGPLNIIAPIAENSPISELCASNSMQSVRLSSHPIASMLARRFGRPIVATSANISGEEALYSVKEHKEMFTEMQPDFVLDGGDLPNQPASTTVRVQQNELEVLRQGSIQIDS